MLIWSGRGWLIVVVSFACLLLTELISEYVTGDDEFYQQHGWTKLVAFAVAAAIVAILVRTGVFDDLRGTFVEKRTGKEVELGIRHTLFFVPARYWPLLLVALGALFLALPPS